MQADVVVIGSGAGGAAAAWQLTRQGAKVLLLEAGPAFEAWRDYPQTARNWERNAFPTPPGSTSQVSYGDLGVLDAGYDDLRSWSKVLPDKGLGLGTPRRPNGQGYSHVMGVGGTTLHFVGEAHRLHPDAFLLQTLTGKGVDWPIGYDALEPFYTQAEKAIGVAGPNEGTYPRSAPYPMAAHPLSPGARQLVAAGEQVGQPWRANARAVNSTAYDDRPACNYCGVCSRGCPLGDKGSADVTFIRKALGTGNLTLIPQARVTRLVQDGTGRITHVDYVHDGQSKRQETPIVVLSAGAVNTPRLLLASADAAQPDGLANGSGQVGRNFMETLSWHSVALVPGLRNSHMGLPADAVCTAHAAPGSNAGVAGGFHLTHTTLDTGLNGPLGYASRIVEGFGEGYKDRLRRVFGSALSVGAVGQVIADERSRVDLDPQRRDDMGQPVARISSVLTRESLDLMRQMAGAARLVLQATGGELVEEIGAWDGFQSTHVFGTARMGTDAARSVVRPDGRSHDHPNLWIADASVFPTSGGGEAPSLTIMALALRTADAILA